MTGSPAPRPPVPDPADRVAAYLAEAQQRADWVRKCERSRTPDAPYTLGVARRNSARDIRPLLAAVKKVLELAGELECLETAPPSGELDEAAVRGIRWTAARVRKAISRELLGDTP